MQNQAAGHRPAAGPTARAGADVLTTVIMIIFLVPTTKAGIPFIPTIFYAVRPFSTCLAWELCWYWHKRHYW